MDYNNLYNLLKAEIPEGSDFFKAMEKDNLIDSNDGMHIIFGMVIVPYIIFCLKNDRIIEIKKTFSFLERMAVLDDDKVNEVLDFTVLEQLVDEGKDVLESCKHYMGINTLKHCEGIENFFN